MLKIIKFNNDARKQIEEWDNFHHSNYKPEYQELLEALEAYDMKDYMDRILQCQRKYKTNERFSYVLTNNKGRVVAFTFFYLRPRDDDKYDMFIQSIAVNPKYRRGYATKLLGTILPIQKYI